MGASVSASKKRQKFTELPRHPTLIKLDSEDGVTSGKVLDKNEVLKNIMSSDPLVFFNLFEESTELLTRNKTSLSFCGMNYRHCRSITEIIDELYDIDKRAKEQGIQNLTNCQVCEGSIQVMDNLLQWDEREYVLCRQNSNLVLYLSKVSVSKARGAKKIESYEIVYGSEENLSDEERRRMPKGLVDGLRIEEGCTYRIYHTTGMLLLSPSEYAATTVSNISHIFQSHFNSKTCH